MLTGKALFDQIATAAQPFINNAYAYNGLTYTLTFCASVTGPYSNVCEVGGVVGAWIILDKPVDALVFRYGVAAGTGRNAVDPTNDIRVLTYGELPDNPTNAQAVAFLKQLLEDAR